MTLPEGAIYQLLRQRAIDTVPAGTVLNYRNAGTLADWHRNGAYTVSGATGTSFSLITASVDIGGALLSDAQFHLDHAAEHQAAVWHDLRSGQWNSPAWLTVTFYYWGYFVAMALSRLLGETVWFLDDAMARQLNMLAPGAAKSGAGTYQLLCGTQVSATDRQIALRKRNGRLHEQLWSNLFSALKTLTCAVPKGSADPLEERIYLALLNSTNRFGLDWPSKLRNSVNYRPGYAYDAVRRSSLLGSFGFLRVDRPQDLLELVGRLETNTIEARNSKSLDSVTRLQAHMLVDTTLLLHLLATTLQDDLVSRHGLDRRWNMKRDSFAERNGLVLAGGRWPI